MNEIDDLKKQVADLQSACMKMFAFISACVPGQASSKDVLRAMYANRHAGQAPGQAQLLDEMTTAALMAVSSVALKQFPNDPAVLEIYQGLRPGQRH